MDWLLQFFDFVVHLDQEKLANLVAQFGPWFYGLMFLIIFCETGLVVMPFLPGDSLLFALGTLCVGGQLDLVTLIVLLCIAAILGDSINYWIGSILGPRLFRGENVRFLNKKHLDKTHEFFERYGAKTIILARFIPIVRTFAPFVAGMGKMTYGKFMLYNVVGGIVWVSGFLVLGYFFAEMPMVKKNFKLVILGIIVISVLPGVIELLRERSRLATAKPAQPTP
jgi:membrane-associated protein